MLLPAEKAFLRHAFKRDRRGKLVFAEQIYSCPKKSGKSAFDAMYTSRRLLFGGQFAEAYVIANDLEQGKGAFSRPSSASSQRARCCDAKPKSSRTRSASRRQTPSSPPLRRDYTGAAGANPVISVFDERGDTPASAATGFGTK